MTEERRKHQRKKQTAVIAFNLPGKNQNGFGRLRDLGLGGMQISSDKELQIGEVLEFLDTESLPWSSGTVRWCYERDGFYLIGIEFSEPLAIKTGLSPLNVSREKQEI